MLNILLYSSQTNLHCQSDIKELTIIIIGVIILYYSSGELPDHKAMNSTFYDGPGL